MSNKWLLSLEWRPLLHKPSTCPKSTEGALEVVCDNKFVVNLCHFSRGKANILSSGEVGSPVNSLPGQQTRQTNPLAHYMDYNFLTHTNKYAKQYPPKYKQNTKTWWAWHATIIIHLSRMGFPFNAQQAHKLFFFNLKQSCCSCVPFYTNISSFHWSYLAVVQGLDVSFLS